MQVHEFCNTFQNDSASNSSLDVRIPPVEIYILLTVVQKLLEERTLKKDLGYSEHAKK